MGNIINQLCNKSIIEYVPDLTLFGDGTYRCSCPIHHGDNATSFAVFPSGSFYCFACNAHGNNVIDYVMQRDNCSIDMAVATLCSDFGLEISADDKYHETKTLADKHYAWMRSMEKDRDKIIDYLRKRGLNDETIADYHLGYSAKLQAISIPMFDSFKRVAGFIYRYLNNTPKYKQSKNSDLLTKGEFLFGIPQAMKHLKDTKTLYLCEGAFDCMSGVQSGLCTVGYCGISVTERHVDLITKLIEPIKNSKVVLVPDNDGKASKFVIRAREFFRKRSPKTVVKVAQIQTEEKDFNEILANHKDITKCISIESLDLYCAKQIIAETDDREVQENDVLSFIKTVNNPLVKADIAEFLSDAWGRDISLVKELLSVQADTMDEKLNDIVSVEEAYAAFDKMDKGEHITTGFPNIDESITMIKTDVTMIAAYSFMGKTSTLCQMILNWCVKQKLRVVFFSLEMPRQRVMQTLVAQIVGIPKHKALEYIHAHRDVYQMICEKLSNHLYIVDRNDLSIDDIEDYIKVINTRIGPVDVAACDYFGYLRGTDTVEEQENTAKKMKAIAKRNNILFVMLSQLNKASQNKDNGRIPEPNASQIKGAGGQGASADTILLLWKADVDTSLSPIDREKNHNISYIKVGKARESKNGNTIFKMRYDPATSKVSEVVDENFLGADKK